MMSSYYSTACLRLRHRRGPPAPASQARSEETPIRIHINITMLIITRCMLDVQISIGWFGCAVHLDYLNTAILGVSLGQKVHAQRFPAYAPSLRRGRRAPNKKSSVCGGNLNAKADSRSLLEYITFIHIIFIS